MPHLARLPAALRTLDIATLEAELRSVLHFGMGAARAAMCAAPHDQEYAALVQWRDTVMAAVHLLFDTSIGQARAASELLRQFAYTRRYIDDLISLHNPFLQQLLYRSNSIGSLHGIYPGNPAADQGLRVTLQHHQPDDIPYMDVRIKRSADADGTSRLRMSLFDKLQDPSFTGVHITRYVPAASNVDDSHKRHVLTGQLMRFATNCSTPEDFAAAAGQCIGRLAGRGYPMQRLRRSFKSTLRRYPNMYPCSWRAVYRLAVPHMDIPPDAHLQQDAGDGEPHGQPRRP